MKKLTLFFGILLGFMNSVSAVRVVSASEINRDEHPCLWKIMSRVEIELSSFKRKSYVWKEHGSALMMSHGSRYYGLSAAHIFPSYSPLTPPQAWFLVKSIQDKKSRIPITKITPHENYFGGSWVYDLAFLELLPSHFENIARGASLSNMGRQKDSLPLIDGQGSILASIDFGLGPQFYSREQERIPRRWIEKATSSKEIHPPSSEGRWLEHVSGNGPALWQEGYCIVCTSPLSSDKRIDFLFEINTDKVIGIYSRGGFVCGTKPLKSAQDPLQRVYSYFSDPGSIFYPIPSPRVPEEYITCFTNLLMYEDWISRQMGFK